MSEVAAPAAPDAGAPSNHVASTSSPGAPSEPVATAADGGALTSAEVLELANLGELGSRMVKLKVNGEEVTLPLSKALENARLGTAAFRKLDEAASIRKEAEGKIAQLKELLTYARENPLEFIERFGPDAEERLYGQLEKRLKRAQMSPEERRGVELEEREQALLAHERRLQEQAKQREQQEREAQVQASMKQHYERLVREFDGALTAVGLDPDDRAEGRQRMAELISEARKRGVKLDAQDAARIAAEEIEGRFRSRLQRRKGDDLAKLLGESQRAELRRLALDDIQRPKGNGARPAQASNERKPILMDGMSRDEFSEYLSRRMRGG